MKKDIADFVQKCLLCQQIKVEHKKTSVLLVPLPVLSRMEIILLWIFVTRFSWT